MTGELSVTQPAKPSFTARAKSIAILVLIVFAASVQVILPILAWQYAQIPFTGMLFEHTLVVSNVFGNDWAGESNLLENPDRLLAVDGQPVGDSQTLRAALETQTNGDTVTLTFQKTAANQTNKIPITLTAFNPADLFVLFGIPYLVGLAYFGIGLFVYWAHASERAGEVFIFYTAITSIVIGSIFNLYTDHTMTTLWTLAVPLAGSSMLHLALVFPAENKLVSRYSWLRFIPHIPAILLIAYSLFTLNAPDPTAYFFAWQLNFGFVALAGIIFFISSFYNWKTNISPLVKRQSQVVFFGGLAAYSPVLVWLVALTFGYNPPINWASYLIIYGAMVIFPLAVGYAILRYQLLKLDIVVNNLLLYLSLTLLAALTFSLLALLLWRVFNIESPITNPIFLIVYGLLLVAFVGPVKDGLAKVIRKLTYSAIPNYDQMVRRYGRQLAELPLDIDGIFGLFETHLRDNLDLTRHFIFFIDDKMTAYDIRDGENDQAAQVQISYLPGDSLPQHLQTTRTPLRFNADGKTVIKTTVDPEELARMAMLNIQLVIPLFGRRTLLGWTALAPKANGTPFTPADVTFIENLSTRTGMALENAQLITAANRKAAEMLAVQQTNLDIASAQDRDQILAAVVDRATNLLGAAGGLIYLVDSQSQTVKPQVCSKLPKDFQTISFNLGQGITGKVAAGREATRLGNYRANPEQSQQYPNNNFGPIISVPLAWQDKTRGVLELLRPQDGPHFSDEDVDILKMLANQAAIALENTRLIAEANSKATQLTTLNEVNRVISATLDRDAALKLVLSKAVEILACEAGSIFLVTENKEKLIFEVALGPTGMTLVGAAMAINTNSIAGAIAATRDAAIVNNVADDPRWNTKFDEESDFTTRDILGVPMIAYGDVIGVIEVINRTDGQPFTPDDQHTLNIFAGQAAIAIVNAERFTKTDRALADRVSELTTLELIDRDLNASLNLHTVFRVTLDGLMDFLGASVGLIAMMDEEQEGLLFTTMVGVSKAFAPYQETAWPLDQGIIGKVARTGQPMLADQAQLDNLASDGRSTSQVCVPIIGEENVMGVISLEGGAFGDFSEADMAFAGRLVSHAVLAIQNARLFEQVKAANDAKTEFMSVTSHEMKIPMTSIKGYAKMLELTAGSKLTDQEKDFLRVITGNVDRMNRLVSDLLDVSRIEAGRVKLEVREVHIDEVVEDVVQSVQTQITDKSLTLVTNIPANTPTIQADYGRMVQIMTNLISNAYKYTPDGGRIEVKTEVVNGTQPKQLSIQVIDTGYGISEEDQHQLFSKFFRAADDNIRQSPGTGLGLSITRGMVEMHGGEMWFQSKLGQGSTFGFNLPIPV